MTLGHRLRRILPAAAEGDPNFASVVFLSGFEGFPSFIDESAQNHTLTVNVPSGALSGTDGLFGTQCVSFVGGANLSAPAHASWDFGAPGTDFTIEARVRAAATYTGADGGFLGAQSVANTGWFFALNGANETTLAGTSIYFWAVDVGVFEYNFNFSVNTWYAVAVQRAGSVFTIFVDGTAVGSTTNSGTMTGGTLRIGNPTTVDAAVGGIIGRVEELRITKGVARYSAVAGYTPATAIFPRQ